MDGAGGHPRAGMRERLLADGNEAGAPTVWRRSARGSREDNRQSSAHIRKALRVMVGDDGALVSDRARGGVAYRLDIVSDCVDAFRFERQVAIGCRKFERGLHEEAAAALDGALG